MKAKSTKIKRTTLKHTQRTPSWVFFLAMGMICSKGVDIFVPDIDMAQHATPLEDVLPTRLEHAEDVYMQDSSHDVTVVLPFEIRFRMLKSHARRLSDTNIKRKLQAEFNLLLPGLRRLQNRDVPLHTEILRHAKAVRVTGIARSKKPDKDYADVLEMMDGQE